MNIFASSSWIDIFDQVTFAGLVERVHMFQNNHVPVFTDTIADYVEATFSGYGSSIVLVWGAAFVNGSNQGEIDASPVTWTHNAGATSNTIYGIYVTDGAGNLAYAERFQAPIVMSSLGDAITYTPRVTLINQ